MARVGSEVLEGGEQINPLYLMQREPLLRTKLFVPPIRPNRVARPRLIEQLNTGLEKPFILISAPAGYGKTTLVSGWLHETELPSAWLSLDEGDNDPLRFFQNFIAALHKSIPGIRLELSSAFLEMQPVPIGDVLNILINEIAEQAMPFILVLDDFHTIDSRAVLEMLAFLLEHMPPKMHLLLLSRTDPPLPLVRMRARDQLAEIRAEQLRFTDEETAVFLNEVMGLRLSADDILAMGMRTEGWIAGLQLASIAMQKCNDVHSFVSAFTGSHHYIMDYLTEEVLKLQPERIRSFLLQTSILGSMCGSLCDEVLGDKDRQQAGAGNRGLGKQRSASIPLSAIPFSNSQQILDYLERANLFVIPLDNKRQWYRYHHLFADMLNRRLEHQFPGSLLDLHRRASYWYEQHSIIPEATHHALMAGDQSRVAELVEQNGCTLLMRGEGFTLLQWVETIEAYTLTHPWLGVLRAWALALTGQLDQVEPALQAVEGLIPLDEPTIEVKIVLGSAAAARAYLANQRGQTSLAANYARGALEYLPEGNAFSCSLRSVAISILGDASRMEGNLDDARHAYLEAIQISQTVNNTYMVMIANANLADVMLEQGELHLAARMYSETLKIASRPDGQKLPLADRLYAGLGKISYEWNQLEAAAQYVHECIELCQQWGNLDLLAEGYLLLAQIERARCNPEKAQEALRAAEQMGYEQRLSTRQLASVEIFLARWWITQGSLKRAAHILQQVGMTDSNLPGVAQILYQQEPGYMLLLRLLLAQGNHEAAVSLSERLLEAAEARKRMRRVIEILALQALIFQDKRDMARALEVLDKALTFAEPEGYVRTVLDEGEPMVKLLYQAKTHRIGGGFPHELLSAYGKVPGAALPPAQLLNKPLTLRELEVLKLIATGLSNPAIAERLVISVPTVKRHISNLYTKLGVKSRVQAVSLGRELRLFE